MNVLNDIRAGRLLVALTTMALLSLSVPCRAQHQATLVLKSGGRADGVVRYLVASRSYEITSGPAKRLLNVSDVERVILAQPPAQLSQAVDSVNKGNYQAAIPVLAKIVEDYAMFGPDVVAGQALALAYLRTNRAAEALKISDDLIRMNPEAAKSGPFASVYWETLLAAGREPTLRISLREAIETGSRELAAVALVRRGDLEMKSGKPKEALLDGYLRAVLLFQDIGFIQPEALYKAIKAHEALNEVAFAERWRKRLLSGYATSEYATKIK
jgi:tetratricopeptide (TPR) repeat protein